VTLGFELQSVTKRYDEVQVLAGVSFSIEPGAGLAIIGPSGCGKSTTLRLALASQPRFLFLDEPFSGLDLVTRAALLDDIARLRAERQITLVLVSHDPIEATRLCRTGLLLNRGLIEEEGEFDELLRNPKSEILKVFKANLNMVAQG